MTRGVGRSGTLTLDSQSDGQGAGVALNVAGLAGVAAGVATGHLLHHQAPVGQ